LIIPISQTVHILGVAIVMIAVGMLNLKLLGIRVTRQSFAELSARWMPWIWGAMAVLFVTGAVQTIAEPTREIMNNTFRIKIIMLVIAVGITVIYRAQVTKDPKYWERSGERRTLAYALASLSQGHSRCRQRIGRYMARRPLDRLARRQGSTPPCLGAPHRECRLKEFAVVRRSDNRTLRQAGTQMDTALIAIPG
jgi:hypothetical protein